MSALRVTVWNEHRHEQQDPRVRAIYPRGIHGAIADSLQSAGYEVRTATLDEPEHGLTEEVLADTDVLVWWGHMAHEEVRDEVVDRVQARILEGMGLLALHSAHYSKLFRRLMGTGCELKWRHDDRERLWVVDPAHPIVDGLPECFELEEEMYGEFFDVPQPEQLVFISWFASGYVFRSGCCYTRGRGKVFYFRPGHETNPTYHDPNVQRVIVNAVRWLAPPSGPSPVYWHAEPLEQARKPA